MSSQGGMWNFDNEPVQRNLLFNLGRSLEERGPDGGREVYAGPVGMTFRGFFTTAEAHNEFQPISSPWGHVLTWDGRLDNRTDLIASLPSTICAIFAVAQEEEFKRLGYLNRIPGGSEGHFQELSDAAIVLAGYVTWGPDVVSKLIGEFAFSLWDPESHTLLLARDFAGTRPLMYHMNSRRVVWSSELSTVLAFSSVSLKPNGEYVAGYLSRRTDPRLAPYEGVNPIPPGCTVLVKKGEASVHAYWKPDASRELSYACDREYEEHFRTLFHEAVRCRLRGDRPIWCELSGGLDSSSIVCMAGDIIANEGGQNPPIETLSWIFDNSPTADERNYIAHVERVLGRHSHYIREDDYPALIPWPGDLPIAGPSPQTIFSGYLEAQSRILYEHGARVLLTGFAGDHLLWSEVGQAPPDIADVARRLRLRVLHQATRAWSLAEQGSYFQMLLRGAVLYNLPTKLQATFVEMPPWLNRKFVRSSHIRESLLTPYEVDPCLPSRSVHITVLSDAISFVSACFTRELTPVELRFPFLHRPLVEFCLAVPMQQKIRPGHTRSLHRRALREVLPPAIATRKDKRGPDEAIYRAIERERVRLRSIFRDSVAASYEFIDGKAFQQELEGASHGVASMSSVALTRTITLEFWLRGIERWKPIVQPQQHVLDAPMLETSDY